MQHIFNPAYLVEAPFHPSHTIVWVGDGTCIYVVLLHWNPIPVA